MNMALTGQVRGWPPAPWGSREGDAEVRSSLEGGVHGLVSSEHEPRHCSDGLVLEGPGRVTGEAGRGF